METASSSFQRQQQSAYKWTDEDTKRLIRWWGRNKALFTGKRNTAIKVFEALIKEHGLEGQEIKAPSTGVSTEGGEATAANLKKFNIMDEVMRDRPTISPLNLITSSMTPAAVASPPNPNSESPPVRGRRTNESRSREWLQEWMKDFEEREDERLQQTEERERRAEERERQEKREMEERWARREREWRRKKEGMQTEESRRGESGWIEEQWKKGKGEGE
ncbi:uncharacterized protein LOC122971204 [Xyrichtys novacula]|uniref:Uncharacterized protein LOC122971204 n=1 Tax=Xyrichtys novacula TaxID=13765 RepID=A0AAV1H945_XYRNO|nr:uncharacterized protein LOC122971204 [Xyrichtys novacula]